MSISNFTRRGQPRVGHAMGCNQETRPEPIARFLSVWSSRRKRPFFPWDRLLVGLPLWERQLLSWHVLKKTVFARRAQRTQSEDSCELPGNAELQCGLFSGNALGTPNFSSACLGKETQQSVSRDFAGSRSQPAGYPAITHKVIAA